MSKISFKISQGSSDLRTPRRVVCPATPGVFSADGDGDADADDMTGSGGGGCGASTDATASAAPSSASSGDRVHVRRDYLKSEKSAVFESNESEGGASFERHRRAGCECAEAGNMSGAIAEWNKALELSPDDYLVLEMKAQALLGELRLIDASRTAQQVVSLAPHWAEGHVTLARVYRELGEVALALEAYDEAARLDPLGVGADAEVREERAEMRLFAQRAEETARAIQAQREVSGEAAASTIQIPAHIPSHKHDEVLCCMQHLHSRAQVVQPCDKST